ncbi:MAG TPA: molybdenum cofactor guanylyltransferase MobA [Burkholderiaceae bacterium]|nr:molybdenum cofactor guanylyltransferase MobA [Burkholderiaceae bacterium]
MRSRSPSRESITGVVLAGGRGARMGGADKGLVQFEGRLLIAHVLARLRPQVGEVIISANRNLERYRAFGDRVVEDDQASFGAFCGPLAGMLAGLRHARLPWVAFVPCDSPAVPLDLVTRLSCATDGEQRPAVAVCDGRRQVVFCLMPTSLEPRLAATLAAGERRPREFLRALDAIEVTFDDPQAFANINTATNRLQRADD